MKHRFKSFDFLSRFTLGGGVLLVVFGGFRMGLQYLEVSEAILLNPINVSSLTVGVALLLFGMITGLTARVPVRILSGITVLLAAIYVVFVATDGFKEFDAIDKRCAEKICAVHGEQLQEGTVDIAYGLLGHPRDWDYASSSEFPYANSSVAGGCVIEDDSPKYAIVRFCSKCRASEREYWKRHGVPSAAK